MNESERILRELDVQGFYDMMERRGTPFPTTNSDGKPRDIVALATLHKVRCNLRGFSDDEKETSKKWLLENGFSPGLFGIRVR